MRLASIATIAALVIGALLSAACTRSEPAPKRVPPDSVSALSARPSASARVSPAASSPARAEVPPAPIVSGPSTVALEVPDFGDAVVVVPVGARAPVSWIIALHGNFDRPEWQCEVWGPAARESAFVVCPRGVARTDVPRSADRWTYATMDATRREIEAVEKAFSSRFGHYVSEARPTLLGFSLGAIYGARIAAEAPDEYPRLVLIEGGEKGWSRAVAQRYRKGGGERLLIACAQTVCRNAARALEPVFQRAELPYRHAAALGAGHTYDGKVAALVFENWDWALGGADSAPDQDTRSAPPKP